MNRLTRVEGLSTLIKDGWKKKDTEKNYTSICYGCEEIRKCVNKCGFCKALDKLAAYEDTGLEPEELKQLKLSDENKEESSIKYYIEMRKYRDELKYYKKLEAQGLLIKLPCKVGTDIFRIVNKRIGRGNNRKFNLTIQRGKAQWGDYDKFGKTAFLTREEAGRALEEEDE